MDKREMISFFDELAPSWDAGMKRSDEIIEQILDYAGVTADKSVLDIACGTGVLFPDYLKRQVKSVTGIDISPKMIACAEAKFDDPRITLIRGDAENAELDEAFDCCIVYNALPHFIKPEKLIKSAANALKTGGRLTIAHGMSREKLNRHHGGLSEKIATKLMSAEELSAIFEPSFKADICVSNDKLYVVSGTKRI